MKIETVGVVGLGRMGGPVARHLAGRFAVVGHDVRPEAAAGVAAAASCRDLARRCDLAIVAVGFDSQVEAVVFGEDGLMAGADGLVIAVASTIAPAAMKDLAARGAGGAAVFLDIPMRRGEQAAVDGDLLIMGGGDEAVFDSCRPAFETFASAIHHLGALGNGQAGKMINNLILWACVSANVEGLRLAGALGVEAAPLRAALLASSARNWPLETMAHEGPMPWAEKDMSIVLRLGQGGREGRQDRPRPRHAGGGLTRRRRASRGRFADPPRR